MGMGSFGLCFILTARSYFVGEAQDSYFLMGVKHEIPMLARCAGQIEHRGQEARFISATIACKDSRRIR